MSEWLNKIWHWLFIPNFHAMVQRDLDLARIKRREYEANASYSSLMVQYYGERERSDEALLKSVATAQQTVAPQQQADLI